MRLSVVMLSGLLKTFQELLDGEDLIYTLPAASELVGDVNRRLDATPDPDPCDVSEAIWQSLEGIEDIADPALVIELEDIIEARWKEMRREA